MKKDISKNIDCIKYKIFDPTKNITILVESDVDVNDQPTIAKALMEIYPNAEQVGFVSFDENKNIKLRMAGGEFCGNATMCAGVYAVMNDESNNRNTNFTKNVFVDALKKYVEVEVKCIDEYKFVGTVNMPRAKAIKSVTFPDGDTYDVVYLQGISHIIININQFDYKNSKLNTKDNSDNVFDNNGITKNVYSINTSDIVFKEYFENKIKSYCDYLDVESLGIIFYDKNKNYITPLVHVKNADTLYWENSCASGSIAVYEYLKNKNAELNTYRICQPCNEYLNIFEKNDKLYLSGEVRVSK